MVLIYSSLIPNFAIICLNVFCLLTLNQLPVWLIVIYDLYWLAFSWVKVYIEISMYAHLYVCTWYIFLLLFLEELWVKSKLKIRKQSWK